MTDIATFFGVTMETLTRLNGHLVVKPVLNGWGEYADDLPILICNMRVIYHIEYFMLLIRKGKFELVDVVRLDIKVRQHQPGAFPQHSRVHRPLEAQISLGLTLVAATATEGRRIFVHDVRSEEPRARADGDVADAEKTSCHARTHACRGERWHAIDRELANVSYILAKNKGRPLRWCVRDE